MGGDESKAQEPENRVGVNPEDENHFFVQEITKMSLKNCKQVSYYWIDPKVYNAENQKYYNMYLQNFKIDSFTSLEGLKSELEEIENQELIKVITAASLPDDDYRHLQQEKKVAQVFLFCGNQERAKLLSKNFTKIKGYGLKCQQVIDVLKKAELEDQLQIAPCTLLSMLEEDRKILNKYRLNYFCITNKHPKSKSKEDFVTLARALYPEQQQKICQFQKEYSIDLKGDELYIQTLRWALQDSFFWKLIQNLPKATVDPKKLAYLRLPFSDLFQAISKKHKQIQKIPEQLYIVVQLSLEQIEKIQSVDSLDNFIIFTSFIKGYTKKADAIKDMKQIERSFLFSVNFTKREREKDLDFGFYISTDKALKKNVIFNIYNFFQLQSLEAATRSGTLVYGPLAEAFYNRANPNTKKRLTDKQSILLRNYDYLEDLIKKDDSQAVILQMSGYFKESVQVYDRKVEYLKRMNAHQTLLNKYIILRGDAYRINQDYEEAEKQYRSIQSQPQHFVGLVHLLQLFLKKGDDKRAQEVQQNIQYGSNMRKLKEKYPQEAFKAENFIALSWMKQGKYKEALKKYKNLQAQASLYYNYRFQGIPLIHDIFRNMATCQSKLQNHKQALNLLNSTKDWQLVCEGESANLAITQTMLHHVYEDMGNKESARTTADVLTQLRQSIGLPEKRYLDQSMVAISMGLNKPIIKQSAQNGNMNPSVIQQSTVNVNLNPNVNQSAVNINLNPNVNINQSRVNVNLNDPLQNNLVIKQSSIQVNVSDPKNKQPVNINNSSVDIKL